MPRARARPHQGSIFLATCMCHTPTNHTEFLLHLLCIFHAGHAPPSRKESNHKVHTCATKQVGKQSQGGKHFLGALTLLSSSHREGVWSRFDGAKLDNAFQYG